MADDSNKTATKAHVGSAVAGVAALIAPILAPFLGQIVDPSYVAQCLDAKGLTILFSVPGALIAAGTAWWTIYQARNKPKTA